MSRERGKMSGGGEDMVAYCGLYCEDCPIHKGKIAGLARDPRKELRGVKFDETAEAQLFVKLKSAARKRALMVAGNAGNSKRAKNLIF